MNADPADTRYPHLDLGDLIAEAARQPIGDRAREHLAACEHCQLEANRVIACCYLISEATSEEAR